MIFARATGDDPVRPGQQWIFARLLWRAPVPWAYISSSHDVPARFIGIAVPGL